MTRGLVAGQLLRVRRVPVSEPPYDDDPTADWPGPHRSQPLLALSLTKPPHHPPAARSAPGGPDPTVSPAPGQGTRPVPRPGVGSAAAPATVFAAARFVNTCLEILNGYRPVHHLRALATPLAASAVVAAMTHAIRRLRAGRPAGHPQALLKLRRMRTCEPRPGVAEIAVVVAADRPGRAARTEHAWALAYRLEQRHGRWLCATAALL